MFRITKCLAENNPDWVLLYAILSYATVLKKWKIPNYMSDVLQNLVSIKLHKDANEYKGSSISVH